MLDMADSSIIKGTVIDAQTQKPLDGILIFLNCVALQGQRETYSNEAGAYQFTELPLGTYTLKFMGGAFQPYVHLAELFAPQTRQVDAELQPASSS
jgi:hypothetical protein